jgi:hypothetical protein
VAERNLVLEHNSDVGMTGAQKMIDTNQIREIMAVLAGNDAPGPIEYIECSIAPTKYKKLFGNFSSV